MTDGRPHRSREAVLAAALTAAVSFATQPALSQTTSVQDQIDQLKRQLQQQQEQHDKEVKLLQQQIRSQHDEVKLLQNQIRQLQQKAPVAGRPAVAAAGAARVVVKQRPAQEVSNLRPPPGSAVGAPAAAPPGAVAAAAPPAPAPAPASTGPKIGMVQGRPTISSADGQYTLSIGSLIQFDTGGYFQGGVTPPNNEQTNGGVPTSALNNGYNLRRAYFGINGRVAGDWTYALTGDFGGVPDGTVGLNEANVNYVGINPLIATIGYFNPWYTLADSTGARNFLFLEEPSITEIARSLAAGTARASFGVKASGENTLPPPTLPDRNLGPTRPMAPAAR
jgi:phosphate-selective porin OprO and OprP